MKQITSLNYWDDTTDEFVDHWLLHDLLIIIKFSITSTFRILGKIRESLGGSGGLEEY